ncbi:uncharacterized protein LOC111783448 isoform X2 [Cucurbita pepo subsp. pepo]|uniref:uncharacterized protein LOC111783448 isoform X2 n=1 Tax=Cucurbita pepo subsp. pepo TaxID=3664 RepID=UPI000C9D6434|nr:uncharacterized protein LOC111783448 isoform X2 [Cucurbita pepo subsp. pepo]
MADHFCYVCGDVGYAELIITCSKCKVVREHLYCMPNKSRDVPKSWLCGNCTLDEAKSPDDSGSLVQPKMPRHAKTGKVKFLPTEEVRKLSSGGMKGPSKLNAAFGPQRTFKSRKFFESSIPRPHYQASKESQERSSATVPPTICGVKKPSLATCLPSMPVDPVQTLKKAKVKVTDIPAKASSVSRHDLPVTKTGKEVPSPSTKLEDMQKQRKNASLTQEIHAYRGNKGKEVPSPLTKLEDTQKQMKYALMTQEIHAYRDCLPSLHASWKGGFQFIDARMGGEFYDGFLAKPPCVVHGRAYELSRKIPPILQVKLLSRSDIWDELFHDECPDLADIALYFFPADNIERSRKNNSYLFELMEREDLLIRSLIDGAELVVFTYRQLDLHSQHLNMLSAKCLLFGVFRARKKDQSLVPMLEYGSAVSSVESESKVPLLEFTPKGHGKHDEDNAVKRVIDITGGNTTGKSPTAKDVDSTIQRLLLEFGSQKPRESDVNALTTTAQIKDQEPAPIAAATGSYSLSQSKVKIEPIPVIKEEESDRKCLETEHCSRMAPTFSIDGSQNRTGLTDQDVPRRVADKYLQIFNAGIKKERR